MKKSQLLKLAVFFFLLFITFHQFPESVSGAYSRDKLTFRAASLYGSACGLYDSLHLNLLGLSRSAYDLAVEGMSTLMNQQKIVKPDILSIIDFSQPSLAKRLFVIDVSQSKLLFNTYVAHGIGSGGIYASAFSNHPNSFKSCLGFFQTSQTYMGKHGYSLKLEGLEKGINDLADERAIVIHAAPYVSEQYIRSTGQLGRSLGCPALPENLSRPIIQTIKNGSCLFIYGPDNNYLKMSPVLNG